MPIPDPEKASIVTLSFTSGGENTEVEVVHDAWERHGDGAQSCRVASSRRGRWNSTASSDSTNRHHVYERCRARARTNIEFEDTYVRAVMDRYGRQTKTEAVDVALRHLAGQPMTREEALSMRGARAITDAPPTNLRAAPSDPGRHLRLDRVRPSDRQCGRPAHYRADCSRRSAGSDRTVLMEVLAGARDDAREADLRRLLLSFGFLPCEAVTDFEAAARLYRRCRKAGITPRRTVDCMIAAVAHRCNAPILSWDADFDRLAQVVGVELDEASLRD